MSHTIVNGRDTQKVKVAEAIFEKKQSAEVKWL